MKENINNLARLTDLKKSLVENNVSAGAISSIEKAVRSGMIFKRPSDLGILNLPVADVRILETAVGFGNPSPAADVRTLQYSFKPVVNEEYFFGYQFVITYTNAEKYSVAESFPIEDNRVVYVDLDLNDIAVGTKIIYQVKTASGDYAAIALGNTSSEPKEELLEIDKAALAGTLIRVKADSVKTLMNPAVNSSYQVKGKLISAKDEKTEGYQVVLMAALKNTAAGVPDFFPVAYASTETKGYFVTGFLIFNQPQDAENLIAAKAVMSKDDKVWEQPINLLETAPPPGTEGNVKRMIPPRLILVISDSKTEANETDDCKCGCNDLNFHEKKVLEEHSYYTVVRTTEPAIIADTLEDEEEIDLDEIYGTGGKVSISVFRKYQAAVKTQVKPMLAMTAVFGDQPSLNTQPATIARVTTNTEFKSTMLNQDLLHKLVVENKVLNTLKGKKKRQFKGRSYLNPLNQIDWDDEPTIYQAASVAHGHLLHFKQEWLPDGYSIGDILYSLPLAPGQKKQIAVLDWERRESAANSQSLDYEEHLNNTLVRDRDINEVINATLNENIKGSSRASTGGFGFGLGGAVMGVFNGGTFGALHGISGGKSSSSSSANQNSHRDSTASSMQSISDRTSQAASMVRSQRATVIQTVSQGERVQATSESVANYNHCHAITIQYFEVLRHFNIRTRLANVQECLFIPLQITPFNPEKIQRWRNTLETRVFRRELRNAFDAISRILNEKENDDNYYDSIGYPRKHFAEQAMKVFSGELFIEFTFFNTNEGKISDDMIRFLKVFGISIDAAEYQDRSISNKELAEMVGPRTIEFLLNTIVIETDKGNNLRLDLTLLNRFRQNALLRVSIRQTANTPTYIRRELVEGIKIRIDKSRLSVEDKEAVEQLSNKFMKITIRSGNLRYRTDNMSALLFSGSVNNDLFADNDGVYLPTPLNGEELRNPRGEDINLANQLIQHLNENLEYYHKCIWFDMTPERRYMLLDGIIAPGKANGRSVASVVENKLIGIAGNSLIMPVAPGNQLDPSIDADFNLFAQYYKEDNDPIRLSLPTKGVYAESVMGKCNSCEEKDESRFWRWEESPIPDSPNTQILPLNTDTRRADPGNLQAKDFPAPVVNIQNAPNVPDPSGLQAMMQLLGKGDSFRDITGLNQNQLNALATFQKTMDTAQAFGKEAAELAKAAAKLELVKDANKSGVLSTEDSRSISKKTLDPDEINKIDKEKAKQDRQETEKDIDQIDEAKTKNRIDDEEAKDLTVDRIRKGQGTEDKKPVPKKTGKKKYNLTLFLKNYEGRPLTGNFLLTYGSLVNIPVEITGSSVFQQTVELDSSKENILEIKGNPFAPGISSANPDFFFHFAEFPTVTGSNKNLTFEVFQTRVERSIEVAQGTSRSKVIEEASAKELSLSTEIGGEVDLLIATFGSSITITGSVSNTHTESTETGESTTTTEVHTYKVPARRLKVKQKGVETDDLSLEE